MNDSIKILGIDPGYARSGWGIIEKHGQKNSLVEYGCLETSPKSSPSQRLLIIYLSILKILDRFHPSTAAIEDLFFNTNAKTAIKVGEARGAILVALEQNQLSTAHYTPLQIKNAITGYGRADKQQIQKMVKTILSLDHIPKPDDAADALAVALTHAFTVRPKVRP